MFSDETPQTTLSPMPPLGSLERWDKIVFINFAQIFILVKVLHPLSSLTTSRFILRVINRFPKMHMLLMRRTLFLTVTIFPSTAWRRVSLFSSPHNPPHTHRATSRLHLTPPGPGPPTLTSQIIPESPYPGTYGKGPACSSPQSVLERAILWSAPRSRPGTTTGGTLFISATPISCILLHD